MENQVVFKSTAFGGFDKKSVMDYVNELNVRVGENQAQLMAQMDEVNKRNGELSARLQQTEARLGEARRDLQAANNELAAERKKSSDLTGLIDSLNEEVSKQEQIIIGKDAELREHIRKIERIERQNSLLEASRREMEQASVQIGKLMLSSQSEADQIIREANSQAEVITRQADQAVADARVQANDIIAESESLLEEAQVQAGDILRGAEDTLQYMHRQFSAFRREVEQVQENIAQAVGVITKKTGDITQTIARVEENMLNTAAVQLIPEEGEAVARRLEEADGSDFFRSAAEC